MRRPRIERATAEDVVSLATDVGPSPMHVGAVLRLSSASALDPVETTELLEARISSVPRLRQRLVPAPFGCGRPTWVDEVGFDIHHHVKWIECPAPGDEEALLGVAAEVVGARLPPDRPLWRLAVVTGLVDDEAALVVAFHHVVADGLGGLAVLANLVDGAPIAEARDFPRPAPSKRALAWDATRERAAALAGLPTACRRAGAMVSQLRQRRTSRAAVTSLNRPTGAGRRFVVVRSDLDAVHRTAHEHGATVNDVVLAAVGGALGRVLRARGEVVERLVVSVPVSARRQATATDLGNQVGVLPVEVPTVGDPLERLAAIAAATRSAKQTAGESPTALLGPAFRLLARLGLFTWFINRQRVVHTFATNLRGPAEGLAFQCSPITDIAAISLLSGNITVAFAALSYAGTLAVTLVADPEACPDLDTLGEALGAEFAVLTTV